MTLAKFYLEVNQKQEVKILFLFDTKDSDLFLLAMAIGGDGAPGTGIAIDFMYELNEISLMSLKVESINSPLLKNSLILPKQSHYI